MEHKIQISEPWDFKHPLGSNIVTVRGVGVIPGSDLPNWGKQFFLVDVEAPFEMDGELVKQMICAPRYQGDTIDKVTSGRCTIGISRVKPECELKLTSTVDPEQVVYCAIGSIESTQQ
jgi:hypothetical protein